MAVSIGKMAPSAVVLAFVGYCAWPSLSELISTPPPPKAPPKIREVAASLFSPTMPPVPTRNPWGGLDAEALAAAKASAKPADTQSEAVVDAAMAKAPSESGDSLAGLKLDATCILGDQRTAMINGQMYVAQETLTLGTVPYRVVRVLPYKVVLERDGKIMELAYANVASQQDASAGAGVKANPVSTKTSKLKKASDPLETLLKQTASAPGSPSVPEPQSIVGALIKKQTNALESIVKKREAAEAAATSGIIDQPNKAGE